MCGHRLTGPDGADFFRGVIANSEYKIKVWCSGLGKFIPIFASQIVRW